MTSARRHSLSRRGFCLCCLGSATFAATGGWLTPREAFAEARNIVDSIRDDAARAPIKLHKAGGCGRRADSNDARRRKPRVRS